MTTRFVDTPMGRVHVRDDGVAGAALPLLLVHGFASSMRAWDAMLPRLARECRVLRVDVLGHGGSGESDAGYAMAVQADAVAAVLDRFEIPRVLAVAHSGGGDVVVAMTERHRARLAGMVFLGTAPDLSFVHLPPAARLLGVPLLGPILWRSMTESMVRDGLAKTFAPAFGHVPDVFVEDLRRMTYRSHIEGRRALERYKQERDLPARLAGARELPMLVVFGAEDRWVDPRAAGRWAEATRARVEMLPGVGHTAMAEAPERTADVVLDFVRGSVDRAAV